MLNFIQKLTGLNWRANATTLGTSTLSMVYFTAEYFASVWPYIKHVHKVDKQLNTCMRTIKSTPLEYLSVVCNIAPPNLP